KPFCLQTDTSEIGAGAVLFQRGDRPEVRRIITYASKKSRRLGRPRLNASGSR
ncbi:RT RNaseH 2 domain-containing protein, partial [Aphis craccivora]